MRLHSILMLRVSRALELGRGLRAGLRAELQGGDPLGPPCALCALFYCVASIPGGQRCCKAFGRAFGRVLAELWQSFVRSFVQSFCRALVELSVLKFVTWILPQLTARNIFPAN